MDHIKLFFDDLDAMELLGDAEKGRLFTALLVYGKSGEAPQLGGNERFLFPMMRARIDREKAAEQEISKKRREAGKRGIQAKQAKQANAKFAKQNEQLPDLLSVADFAKTTPSPSYPPFSSPPIPPSSLSPVLSPPPKEKPPKGGKKKGPTFEQVLEVAKLRGCPDLAKPFFDYYAAADWRDSEGKPVFNWQQKFVMWQMREEKQQKPKQTDKKPWSYDPGDGGDRSL